MDAFEHLVSDILWNQGYWVRTNVKVNLTKEEKKDIDKSTTPRWELDAVAYKGADNHLLAVECKSFLDSQGVRLYAFDGTSDDAAKRFKLFNDTRLREVVLSRLGKQFHESGACGAAPKITLCLAAGHIHKKDRAALKTLFDDNGWLLWDRSWLRERLQEMADRGYENDVAPIVSKILLKED